MFAKTTIEDSALGLAAGSTINIKCPFCAEAWEKHGRPLTWKPEVSLSITRQPTGLLYHCFRSSCNKSGFIGRFDSVTKVPEKKFLPKPYTWDTVPPPDDILKLVKLTEFEVEKEGILFNSQRGSYVYPIYNKYGGRVGVVDRSYTGRKPKSISYWEEDCVKIHYPRAFFPDSDTVMVVEDIASAIVGCRVIPTVALLGTGLNESVAMALRSSFRNLIVALDEDAFSTGLRIAKRYGLVFNRTIPVVLTEDLKDMEQEKAETLLNNIKGLF